MHSTEVVPLLDNTRADRTCDKLSDRATAGHWAALLRYTNIGHTVHTP